MQKPNTRMDNRAGSDWLALLAARPQCPREAVGNFARARLETKFISCRRPSHETGSARPSSERSSVSPAKSAAYGLCRQRSAYRRGRALVTLLISWAQTRLFRRNRR